ncbi:MAG: hypothetical protein JEZ14_09540 [Marinilabiliaceae bacterium]|nr:hypothetical protein [Marinilabiliaceae bacterium]
MNHKVLRILLILLIPLFIGAGCQKEETPLETDPTKIILGKWELVEMGNYPDMRPVENSLGFKEYLPDSIVKEYNTQTGEVSIKKYWIDTLLHKSIYVPDDIDLVFEYSYSFSEKNNKMELTYTNMIAIFNNFTYKRIE